jgi:predicted membrane protein
MHSLFNILAKPIRVSFVFAVLLLMNTVKANEQKIDTINLESVKKNWIDEINTTEYMQQGSESFKQKVILSPNYDRHGCYNYDPKAHPQNW